MGTKNRSDVVTSSRIMKHINPTDEDEKVRHNNYEVVPKLPTVKITQKSKQGPNLSDFLDTPETIEPKKNGFQLNPIGKEKAFAILKQYNKLVSNETKLSVTNLPPVKVPLSKKQSNKRTVPKPETTRPKPIFTEGISSMSKSSKPSFLVPKDKVLRANLPNNIIVAHKKDNFSFGVKLPRKKSPKAVDDGAKFKQMHNLGLDSLPIVNLEKYMKTNSKQSSGVKGSKPITHMLKNFKPRKLDPIVPDTSVKSTLQTSRSYDFTNDRKNAQHWKGHSSAKSEGKAKVVWVGHSLNSEYSDRRNKILNRLNQQYDSRVKQDDVNRMKFPNRDPTVFGVCSLAPIDIIGQTSKLVVADTNNVDDRRYRNDYKKYPNVNLSKSNVNDYYFESDSDSSLNSNWKNMINAMTYRSSSVGSGTITPHGVPNPPPSYVSSSHEDETSKEPTILPMELSKTMQKIQEERTSLMESASNRVQPTFSAASQDVPLSPPPAIVIISGEQAIVEETSKDTKSTPRRTKEPIPSSVIELRINDTHLNVPKFIDSDRRPPIKSDGFESNSQAQSHSPSDIGKPKTSSNSGAENYKLNIKTLQLDAPNEQNTPVPPVNFFSSEAGNPGVFPKNHELIHEREKAEHDDPFKFLTVNSKTLQFVSPLEVQLNAKRQ